MVVDFVALFADTVVVVVFVFVLAVHVAVCCRCHCRRCVVNVAAVVVAAVVLATAGLVGIQCCCSWISFHPSQWTNLCTCAFGGRPNFAAPFNCMIRGHADVLRFDVSDKQYVLPQYKKI